MCVRECFQVCVCLYVCDTKWERLRGWVTYGWEWMSGVNINGYGWSWEWMNGEIINY